MPLFSRRPRTTPLNIPQIPRTATYIESGCHLQGQLQFQTGVRIEGRIDGEVRARGTVVVGETGEVEASLFADVVVVLGEVTGEIHATTLVALHKGARVRSDITTAGIVVEPGADFRGSIVIATEEAQAIPERSTEPLEFDEPRPIVKIDPVVGNGVGAVATERLD